jgi:chromosome segregation ATPase
MKQRNYVAKYAQTSGSGRHKRKDKSMSYKNQEDWVHIDDYNDEIQKLEDRISELETVNRDMRDDEVTVLSDIMLIRDHYSDYSDVKEELDYIIKAHDHSVRRKAQEYLMKAYPKRTWGEDLWVAGDLLEQQIV